MKFKIDGPTLKDHVGLVDIAVDPKSEHPDRNHVFLMVDSGSLYLCGQNGRYMVRVSKIPVEEAEDGTVMLGSQYWQRLTHLLGDKTLYFESDGRTYAKVQIKGASGKPQKFDFVVMPADQYMALCIASGSPSYKLDKLQLKDAIAVVRATADSGNTLDVVNGVCFEFHHTCVRLIATDLSTLGYAELAAEPGSSAPTDKLIRVVSKESIEVLDRLVAAASGDIITIRTSDDMVSFTSGNVDLVSRRIKPQKDADEYINWQRIIPDSIDGPTFNSQVSHITSAMNMAEVVNGGQPVSVDVTIENGEVNTVSQGLGGKQEGSITADSVFGEVTFRLDSKLVKNALRCFPGNTVVQAAPVDNARRLQVIPTMPNLGTGAYQLWGCKTRKREDS